MIGRKRLHWSEKLRPRWTPCAMWQKHLKRYRTPTQAFRKLLATNSQAVLLFVLQPLPDALTTHAISCSYDAYSSCNYASDAKRLKRLAAELPARAERRLRRAGVFKLRSDSQR